MFLIPRSLWLPVARRGLMLAAGCLAASAPADVVPHRLFSSGAVLQRDQVVPVWGQAPTGEVVTVEFAGQKVSAPARDGRWMVRLQPMAASAEGRSMTIRGAKNTVVLDNLLVGEVWVCSGQSNMQWTLNKSSNGEAVAKQTREPGIRMFQVANRQSGTPLADVKGNWVPCEPRQVRGYSAVGFYFARDLHRALKVPVGMINASVGGTPAELWTGRAGLESHPDTKALIDRHQRAIGRHDPAKAEAAYQAAVKRHADDKARAVKDGKKPPEAPKRPADPRDRGPSSLYNGMIAPLQPFAIRGVIWYQGESNRGSPKLYARLFPALIADWRKQWGAGDFPFLFVQVAPFNAIPPELREVQTRTWLATPKSAMVVITDHGSAGNIHPPAKEPVGHRLSLAARAVAYGEKIVSSGPLYQSHAVEGGKVRVRFGHAGGGLEARGGDGKLKGFTVAGADGKHVAADAVIDGRDMVVVSSPAVPAPVAVRFGWANVPDGNLFNREGLPAVPFRAPAPAP